MGDRQELGGALAPEWWQRLYRVAPDLYDRLIAGEHLHPAIIDWLPPVTTAVEVGAGTGRLTVDLAPRCERLIAVEPAAPMRERLRARVPYIDIVAGVIEALPLRSRSADLIVACSVFTDEHGDQGLAEMERVARLVVIVWPQDARWLEDRGYRTESFPGEMAVDFGTNENAVELARIFYPDAVDEIARRELSRVPYDVLGTNPPRTLCWRRM